MIAAPSSPCLRADLTRLAEACQGTLEGPRDVVVTDVTHDSRRVAGGALFVAVPGTRHDGREFLPRAVASGAVAGAGEGPRPETMGQLPWIRVADARAALADLSGSFWNHPDRDLVLVGVTGTNGKTSTAWILDQALRSLGRSTALLGTLVYRVGSEEQPARRTTPESPEIHRLLRRAADTDCFAAVMEVSSHGLAQQRVRGLEFAAGVFTNLEAEHLDFHGSMEEYFQAKARLFLQGLASEGLSACNADDPRGPELARLHGGRSILFGRSEKADLRIMDVEADLEGLRLRLGGLAELNLDTELVGEVNAWNLAAAAAVLLGLEFDPSDVEQALCRTRPVPGRMETVRRGQAFTVLLDYAHTPEALERLLRTVRAAGARRILAVFGCGGDRDPGKRAPMGAAAARLSDVVILTDDNPRREDPQEIRNAIRAGASRNPDATVLEEPDRARALRLAFRLAGPGDAVVAAGKGDEKYQEIGGDRHPWSERRILSELAEAAAEGRLES